MIRHKKYILLIRITSQTPTKSCCFFIITPSIFVGAGLFLLCIARKKTERKQRRQKETHENQASTPLGTNNPKHPQCENSEKKNTEVLQESWALFAPSALKVRLCWRKGFPWWKKKTQNAVESAAFEKLCCLKSGRPSRVKAAWYQWVEMWLIQEYMIDNNTIWSVINPLYIGWQSGNHKPFNWSNLVLPRWHF